MGCFYETVLNLSSVLLFFARNKIKNNIMKLSISTFKIICSLWNYPEEVLEDKEYLQKTIEQIDREFINFTTDEQ